jgi:mannose-6-phosphate isomerase-like protein (cupin superfamily)
MLQVTRFDPENLKKYEAYDGHYTSWEDLKFDEPSCIAAFSEARPGDDLSHPWHLWNDEVIYIIDGEMELEWSSPPMFNDHQKVVVRHGDLILAKMGLSMKQRVLGDKPVRYFWVSMPRPRYFGSETFWGKAEK